MEMHRHYKGQIKNSTLYSMACIWKESEVRIPETKDNWQDLNDPDLLIIKY